MSNEVRGSEKLKMRCRSMQGLTMEDLDKVAGGSIFYEVFPRGIPWPELLLAGGSLVNPVLPEQLNGIGSF